MSGERRYGEDEVKQILDLAIGSEGAPALVPTNEGLTLRELQEIGREVGVPANRIVQAAAEFEGRVALAPRATFVGLPHAVGSSIALPRSPSDREWELLVAELRTTFGVKGEMTSQGGFREWSHGSIHVFIEPTESGYRLRMTDSRASAIAGVVFGGIFLALALLMFVVLLAKGGAAYKLFVPGVFGLIGGGVISASLMSLPGWARVQEKRMEQINSRVLALLSGPGATKDSAP
jgi:hypothetical protein